MADLIRKGTWSDETEMLARIIGLLVGRPWQNCLPIRCRPSANHQDIPEGEALNENQRNLAIMFGNMAKQWATPTT